MSMSDLLLLYLSFFFFSSRRRHTRSLCDWSSDVCSSDLSASESLKRMQTVKPGMTRTDLLKVFTTEGGLSTGLHRTFVSRDCPYFKVDVEFKAVGRPDRDAGGRVTLVEGNQDIIVKISRPYLQFSIMD